MNQQASNPNVPVIDVEIHIKWVDGQAAVQAPNNPLLVMKVLADAMSAYALEVAKQQEQRIIRPNGAFVDSKLVENAKSN